MSLCFRRLHATLPKLPAAASSTAARTLSSPFQVRRRRLRKQRVEPEGQTSQLSPTEQARYQRLKQLGAFLKEERNFQEPTEQEWLSELNEKRTRIRGAVPHLVEDSRTGKTTTIQNIVGRRIYLPNIIFRMMRNYTPSGQPYNPWEATFRIPNSVTKLDVRSYLYAVYGVKCTYIRTDNYFAPIWRGKLKGHPRSPHGKSRKSYKRAVVGLVEPFYYPEALEDMELSERQAREKWLEEHFHIQHAREMTRADTKEAWLSRGWKNFNVSGNRGAILRSVIARREKREQSIGEGAQTLLESSTASTKEV